MYKYDCISYEEFNYPGQQDYSNCCDNSLGKNWKTCAKPQSEFVPYDTAPRPRTSLNNFLVYPKLEKEAGIEGTVYVKAFINESGTVTTATVLKGVPNTGLDDAALNAVKKSLSYIVKHQLRKQC